VGKVLHDAFLTPFKAVYRLDAGSLVEGLARAKGELLGSITNDLVGAAVWCSITVPGSPWI
jgi:hypothetical protein